MLVAYSDSEDEVPQESASRAPAGQKAKATEAVLAEPIPSKKRKALPTLPTAYTHDNPRDDPNQHQGRKRSRPFTEGDYNMHVFASVAPSAKLKETIQAIANRARAITQTDTHCFLDTDPVLHVSLTHPHPLRRSQISQIRAEMAKAVARHPPFQLSFAGRVSAYVNGKKYGGEGQGGRAFLAIRLAAGSEAASHAYAQTAKGRVLIPQVERVVTDIHPILDRHHLQRYHDNPEFHASFAWCLDDGETPYTQPVLDRVSTEFGEALLKHQPKGGWKIGELAIKIGKDVYAMPLGGPTLGGE